MPLNLAYFGSDLFSINCLKQLLGSNAITKLDVVTRPPKPSGRGLRSLKEVPLEGFAHQNGLNVRYADKKSDFEALADHNYNLCVAVSYGRLIPSTFLSQLVYGGLNVHPSLLPQYYGPAPLQRALLNHESITGVTVQTLHPTEFDRGAILAQEKYSVRPEETYDSLAEALAEKGGRMLREIVDSGAYDESSKSYQVLHPSYERSYARKVEKPEHQIRWDSESSFEIVRQFNTLGPLYTFKKCQWDLSKQKRVVMEDVRESSVELEGETGTYEVDPSDETRLVVKTTDGAVSVGILKIEGLGKVTGRKVVRSGKKLFHNLERVFSM